MYRRHFFYLGFGFLFSPRSAFPQTKRVWRVAFVASGASRGYAVGLVRRALRSLAYEEGNNIIIDYREAGANFDKLPALVSQLIELNPNIIVAEGTPAIAAAQKATSTIPIIMAPATDPVGSGFVKSFAHPGGNITGVANMFGDLTTKSLDVLHAVLPGVKTIAVLTSSNPTHPPLFEAAKRGAETIGVKAELFVAALPADLEATFASMKSEHCEAVYVLADPYRPTIPKLAAKFEIPAIYQYERFVDDGGLMSYGPDLDGLLARVAYYVDRIVRGSSPADIPVEQPTTFHFTVNLRTAKALGLTVPEAILLQADKVIE